MRKTWTAALLLAATAAAHAGNGLIKGELYGVTGSTLHLHTEAGLLKLKAPPALLKGKHPAYGSWWKVGYKGDAVTRLAPLGEPDEAVADADGLLRRYFKLLGAGNYPKAYALLGAPWRRQQPLSDFVSDCRKQKLAWARSSAGHSRVVASAGPREVQEVISIPALGEFYRYTVVKVGASDWKIDHVDQVARTDYERY